MKSDKPKMTLGERLAQIGDLDRRIHEQEKIVKELKQRRAKLETRLLSKFGKTKIDGVKTGTFIASIRKARFPQIKDLRAFQKYVLKHRALDLLHNRVASKAYFDRLENGEAVPGVSVFEKIGISIKARK